MDHSTILTRLNAEIASHSQDAAEAGILLERLLANYAAYTAGPSIPVRGRRFADVYADWETGVANLYTAYDRAVRALMTMAQSLAPRDGFGVIIDPAIRAYDPGTPLTVPPVGVSVAGRARDVGKSLRLVIPVLSPSRNEYDAAIESATNCCRAYQCAREHPPIEHAVTTPSASLDARSSEYLRSKAQAERFIEYLDAV
jgi:hypothetical protein